MGTATLRLGLASLTDTNTRRDASCVQGGSREGPAVLSGAAGGSDSAPPSDRRRRCTPGGVCRPIGSLQDSMHGLRARTMSWGVTPRPREPTAAISLQRTASNRL